MNNLRVISILINTLLSPDKTYIEKREILENDYHIEMSTGLRKEYDNMCNLSDWVEEKGIKRGKRDMVLNLLKLGTVSEDDIMKASGISREQLEEIKKELLSVK